jgi:glutamyl-tRNA reductase
MALQAERADGQDTEIEANGRVIARFRAALEGVQDSELERLFDRLPALTDKSREEIRQFSARLVAKVLDPPLKSLDDGAATTSPQTLLVALERLFKLDRFTEQLPLSDGSPPLSQL